MLWALGVAALLQVVVLPGAVLLQALRVSRLNAIEKGVGAFACSLMINHLLVALFTLLHLQRPVVWCMVIGAELIYLALCWRSWIGFWSVDSERVQNLKALSSESAVAGIFLVAGLVLLVGLFDSNWGSVYAGTDDVANWDHWATEWSAGNFPALTGLYPQLLPTNGSLSYLLIGNTDIKMFSKAVTPLYLPATVLLFLSLALRRRDASYLIGGALYTLMVFHYMGPAFMTYGYADLPVAFFGFLAFYCVAAGTERTDRLAVMAMLFFSLGALLTKQGGVYAGVAAGAYAIAWKWRTRERLLQRDAPTVLLAVFGAFCAVWYAAKFVQIHMGLDSSNMVLLTQVLHQGRNYWQRTIAIYGKFLHEPPSNAYFTIPLSLLLCASLFLKRTRTITAAILLPFLIAYAFWFSYEIRNSLMAFPLVALVCGVVIHEGVSLTHLRGNRNQVRLAVAATAVVGVAIRFNVQVGAFSTPVVATSVAYLALTYVKFSRRVVIPAGALSLIALAGFTCWGAVRYSAEALLAQQVDAARKTIGDRAITESLYRAVRENDIHSGIVTYYWPLRGLPGINPLFRRAGACHPCTAKAMDSALAQYPDAGYLLMPDAVIPPNEISGEFATVFDVHGWRLLEKAVTSPHSIP